jgi:hypothetical protein
MNQLVIEHNVFYFREFRFIYYDQNPLLTKHSIRLFLTNLLSDPETFPELEDVLYLFAKDKTLLPIQELYELERIRHIKFVCRLKHLTRHHRITFFNGDTLEGGQDGYILNDTNTFYPEQFTTLIETILHRLNLPPWASIVKHASHFLTTIEHKHNLVRIPVYMFHDSFMCQIKFKDLETNKAIIAFLHTPLHDFRLLKLVTDFM